MGVLDRLIVQAVLKLLASLGAFGYFNFEPTDFKFKHQNGAAGFFVDYCLVLDQLCSLGKLERRQCFPTIGLCTCNCGYDRRFAVSTE